MLIILVVGVIAGWLAGKVFKGKGFGLVGDAAIGIVAALVNAAIGSIVLLLGLRLVGASGRGGR